MDVVKIGLLGIVSVGIGLFLRQLRPEYAFLFLVAVGLFLFYLCLDAFMMIADLAKGIGEQLGDCGTYVQILLKIIGISYISEFSSGICQDAGFLTLGKQMEMAGKICVLLVGMPVFLSLLDMIGAFF